MSRWEPAPAAVIRIVLIIVAVVLSLYLIYLLRKPLSWVFIAGFLAVALTGPVNFFSRFMPRKIAIALTYLGLIAIPAGIIAIVVPPIVTEGTQLAQKAPQYAQDVQDYVNNNEKLHNLDQKYGIVNTLQQQAEKIPSRIGDAASALGDIGVGLVNSIFATVTILILSVFLVASGPMWIRKLIDLQPPEHRVRMDRAFQRIGRAVGAYVAGAAVQATLAGVSTFIVLSILGVPFAAPLAVLTALADLVPLVGATIGAILVGIVTLFTDFPTATIIWIVWAIVYQQVENSVIQPQIQRRAVDVHAFIVLVAVLFGSTLFGILGALLAIPVAATIQISVREYLTYRKEIRERTGGGPVVLEPPTGRPGPGAPPTPPGAASV
jgi:predicted PurR-regulated permease PerM